MNPDERKWAKDEAKDFAKFYGDKTGRAISVDDAQNVLLATGYRLVDDMASRGLGGDAVAVAYINENGKGLFNATAAERANPGPLGGPLTPEQRALPGHEAHPQIGMATGAAVGLVALGAVAPAVATAWGVGATYDFVGDLISRAMGLSSDGPNVGKSLVVGGVTGAMRPFYLPLNTLGNAIAGKAAVGGYNALVIGTGAFGATAMTNPGSNPDISAGIGTASALLGMRGKAVLPRPIGNAFDTWMQIIPGPAQGVIEKNRQGK